MWESIEEFTTKLSSVERLVKHFSPLLYGNICNLFILFIVYQFHRQASTKLIGVQISLVYTVGASMSVSLLLSLFRLHMAYGVNR